VTDQTASNTEIVGRVICLTDPLGNRSTAAYDALDRLTSRTDTLGQTVSYGYGYDANNRASACKDNECVRTSVRDVFRLRGEPFGGGS